MYKRHKAVETAGRYKKLNSNLAGLEQSQKTFTRLLDRAIEQKLRAGRQIEFLRTTIKDQEQGQFEIIPGATKGAQRLRVRVFERRLNDLRGKLSYYLRKEAVAKEDESYYKERIGEIAEKIEILYDQTP